MLGKGVPSDLFVVVTRGGFDGRTHRFFGKKIISIIYRSKNFFLARFNNLGWFLVKPAELIILQPQLLGCLGVGVPVAEHFLHPSLLLVAGWLPVLLIPIRPMDYLGDFRAFSH